LRPPNNVFLSQRHGKTYVPYYDKSFLLIFRQHIREILTFKPPILYCVDTKLVPRCLSGLFNFVESRLDKCY